METEIWNLDCQNLNLHLLPPKSWASVRMCCHFGNLLLRNLKIWEINPWYWFVSDVYFYLWRYIYYLMILYLLKWYIILLFSVIWSAMNVLTNSVYIHYLSSPELIFLILGQVLFPLTSFPYNMTWSNIRRIGWTPMRE